MSPLRRIEITKCMHYLCSHFQPVDSFGLSNPELADSSRRAKSKHQSGIGRPQRTRRKGDSRCDLKQFTNT